MRTRAAVLPQDEACREVLRATFESLNLLIAERLGFPDRLRRLLGPIYEHLDDPGQKKLRALSAFGGEMAAVVWAPGTPFRNEHLTA